MHGMRVTVRTEEHSLFFLQLVCTGVDLICEDKCDSTWGHYGLLQTSDRNSLLFFHDSIPFPFFTIPPSASCLRSSGERGDSWTQSSSSIDSISNRLFRDGAGQRMPVVATHHRLAKSWELRRLTTGWWAPSRKLWSTHDAITSI